MMNEDLEKVVSELKDLWGDALRMMKPSAFYFSETAYVLGGYLVALALVGGCGDVEKLLKKYGSLLDEYMDRRLNVATRLVLKYLGVDVKDPSNEEVLGAVEGQIRPELRPAMKEILGIHIPVEDVPSFCGDMEVKDSELCVNAYTAVKKGDKEAEEIVRHHIVNRLSKVSVPRNLLDSANTKQLIEVYAPKTSTAQFILLLRALVSGDRDLALLHAEVTHALLSWEYTKKLYDELADALRSGDENSVKRAVAKLYYYHF